jgi:hypothetical protein
MLLNIIEVSTCIIRIRRRRRRRRRRRGGGESCTYKEKVYQTISTQSNGMLEYCTLTPVR